MKFDNVNRAMAAKKPVKSVLHIQSFCLPIKFLFPVFAVVEIDGQ